MRIILDAETDGLLDVCTRVWIIHAIDVATGEVVGEWLEGDLGWMAFLEANVDAIIGHNVVSFDFSVFKKLFNYNLPSHIKLIDTLILSQVLDYNRFPGNSHSLEAWGEFFNQPKQEHEDWTQFSPEMAERCRSDCRLNLRVYKYLKKELDALGTKNSKIYAYLDAEHSTSEWCADAERIGWPFDGSAAERLLIRLENTVQLAVDALQARLGTKTVAVDKVKGVVEYKVPKWTKQGFYDAHTARWFNVDPCSGFEGEERIVEGPYSRIEFEPLSLNSVADVKVFLFRNNWEPTTWNYKTDEGSRKKVKTSPKITEDSLEFLGGDGTLYADFAVAKSRLGVLKTWIEMAKADGNVHGGCMVVGTPSMRARHSIIVNVPDPEKPWGKEMRSLFIAEPGWKLVGCDSSGNQARGLAHYLGDPTYIDTLLNGDIHTFNANAADAILKEMGIDWDAYIISQGVKADEKNTLAQNIAKRKRANAKRILYAFLFGASGGKLWSYIFGVSDDAKGKKFKAGFVKAVPGFKALMDKLENIYGKTSQSGDGYIPGIAGNRIYVDSFHKLLVYLLQATEKATCAAATMIAQKELRAAGIPYRPSIFMHDEIQFRVPEKFAEQAGAIGKKAFAEGPKLFGITIMDGDSKVGDNWYDTH